MAFNDRLNVLYFSELHQKSQPQVARLTGLKYTTVRNIIQSYQTEGKINKLYTMNSKHMILADHVQSIKNLRKWRALLKQSKFNKEGNIILPDETKEWRKPSGT